MPFSSPETNGLFLAATQVLLCAFVSWGIDCPKSTCSEASTRKHNHIIIDKISGHVRCGWLASLPREMETLRQKDAGRAGWTPGSVSALHSVDITPAPCAQAFPEDVT